MVDATPFLSGLSPVQGKTVVARFDGGRLSSQGGLLTLRQIERRLGLADRLARCLKHPRTPSTMPIKASLSRQSPGSGSIYPKKQSIISGPNLSASASNGRIGKPSASHTQDSFHQRWRPPQLNEFMSITPNDPQ